MPVVNAYISASMEDLLLQDRLVGAQNSIGDGDIAGYVTVNPHTDETLIFPENT